MLALVCICSSPQAAFSADKDKGQQISRVIAKEMTAAQKALQAQQWQEALKNLDAAQTKSGLTPFDEKTIYYFSGFANVKLGNFHMAMRWYNTAAARTMGHKKTDMYERKAKWCAEMIGSSYDSGNYAEDWEAMELREAV